MAPPGVQLMCHAPVRKLLLSQRLAARMPLPPDVRISCVNLASSRVAPAHRAVSVVHARTGGKIKINAEPSERSASRREAGGRVEPGWARGVADGRVVRSRRMTAGPPFGPRLIGARAPRAPQTLGHARPRALCHQTLRKRLHDHLGSRPSGLDSRSRLLGLVSRSAITASAFVSRVSALVFRTRFEHERRETRDERRPTPATVKGRPTSGQSEEGSPAGRSRGVRGGGRCGRAQATRQHRRGSGSLPGR